MITTGLLPHAVQEALNRRSVSGASQSYGLVALVVVLILLLEWEALQVLAPDPRRRTGIAVVSGSLLVALGLTIAARLALLIH